MYKQSLRDKGVFEVFDERGQRTAYGFNQNWYASSWQRMAGCGPTAVANIVYYLHCKRAGMRTDTLIDSKSRLPFMEEMWRYVTPSIHGVSSAKMLYEGVLSYADEKRMGIDIDMVDVSKKRTLRPPFQNVRHFIETALDQDIPVAFLNLHHGEQTQLDSWHWVTIISMEVLEDENAAMVEILDEGRLKKIDLMNWYRTTTLGGGFVSFNLKD